jgi:predicted transposase/invertase (TIGR01784 family)
VVLRYLTASVDSTRMDDWKQLVLKSIDTGSEIMPTIAEKWIQEGEVKGMEKGIEKGIEKAKVEDAQKMLAKGMSITDIHDITGLSMQKIQSLHQELK